MSVERPGWAGMSPPVTKKLMVVVMLFIGSLCIVGGFVFAHMTEGELGRNNDIVSHNLTINAENLYKKAKRISPKAIHNTDPEKVIAILLDKFNFSPNDYGQTLFVSTLLAQCEEENDFIPEFIKHSIRYQNGGRPADSLLDSKRILSMTSAMHANISQHSVVGCDVIHIAVVFIDESLCIGYLLGRMTQDESRKSKDIVSINLTINAENLYKKAKRIPPKAVHHSDPGKITTRLLDIFQCIPSDCGQISNNDVAEFIKNSIRFQVNKLIKSIYNSSLYLDSLR